MRQEKIENCLRKTKNINLVFKKIKNDKSSKKEMRQKHIYEFEIFKTYKPCVKTSNSLKNSKTPLVLPMFIHSTNLAVNCKSSETNTKWFTTTLGVLLAELSLYQQNITCNNLCQWSIYHDDSLLFCGIFAKECLQDANLKLLMQGSDILDWFDKRRKHTEIIIPRVGATEFCFAIKLPLLILSGLTIDYLSRTELKIQDMDEEATFLYEQLPHSGTQLSIKPFTNSMQVGLPNECEKKIFEELGITTTKIIKGRPNNVRYTFKNLNVNITHDTLLYVYVFYNNLLLCHFVPRPTTKGSKFLYDMKKNGLYYEIIVENQ